MSVQPPGEGRDAPRVLLWLSDQEPGAEYVTLWRRPQGYRVHSQWIGFAGGEPGRASYRLDLDSRWSVQRLRAVWFTAGTGRRLHVHRDPAGNWQVNGHPRPDLSGCTDVDLSWSPLTNTLPIRRLGLAIGEQRELRVAYIAAASLTVAPDGQRYTRLAARQWRYESLDSPFSADLTVDEDGLVIDYPPLFRRAAP